MQNLKRKGSKTTSPRAHPYIWRLWCWRSTSSSLPPHNTSSQLSRGMPPSPRLRRRPPPSTRPPQIPPSSETPSPLTGKSRCSCKIPESISMPSFPFMFNLTRRSRPRTSAANLWSRIGSQRRRRIGRESGSNLGEGEESEELRRVVGSMGEIQPGEGIWRGLIMGRPSLAGDRDRTNGPLLQKFCILQFFKKDQKYKRMVVAMFLTGGYLEKEEGWGSGLAGGTAKEQHKPETEGRGGMV